MKVLHNLVTRLVLAIGLLAPLSGCGRSTTAVAPPPASPTAMNVQEILAPANLPTSTAALTQTAPALASSTLLPPTVSPTSTASHALPTAQANSTEPASVTACVSLQDPALFKGRRVMVSLEPRLSSRVRKAAGLSGEVSGEIGPGEVVEIVDGPVCLDGYVWWKVRHEAMDLTGWTAEGDASQVWLVTVTPASRLTVQVQADQGWQDTGVEVAPGELFSLKYVSGQVTDGSLAIVEGLGAGFGCSEAICCEPMRSTGRSALIGRLGETGPAFYVGNGGLFRFEQAGRLQLRLNDCDEGLQDNQGTLTVAVDRE